MSLPTCPSCGQSVLEDDVIDCPFCGAAMDGSRGAKNTPRPKANPVANRPGARKPVPPSEPEKPAAPRPESGARPAPAPAARGGKPRVDEDDPFGMGSTGTVDAIQASLKPEKGKLVKVVCPMCEQIGFVAKSAVGKSVRCANDKCMVPVFTAVDPTDHATERKPVRVSDTAEAARRLAESSRPAKRSPLMMYAVLGTVALAATAGVIFMLNRKRDDSSLNNPITANGDGTVVDVEAEDERIRLAAEAAKLAAEAADPRREIAALMKRMISAARSSGVRDKALARKLTADGFLRAGDAAQAAVELNHLATLEDGARNFVRIEPRLAAYWRSLQSDPAASAAAFKLASDDLPSLPRSGRAAADAAMDMSAVLVHQNRLPDAAQLLATRRLDGTTPANRDLMAGIAWLYASNRCRLARIEPPAALDSIRWADPFSTAVAIPLAIQKQWAPAIAWAVAQPDQRFAADALIEIADIAHAHKAGPDVFAAIRSSVASATNRVQAIRVLAAAATDGATVSEALAELQKLPAATPVIVPNSTELVQQDVPDRTTFVDRATAAAEVARAAVRLAQTDALSTAMMAMEADLSGAAPVTATVRAMLNELTADEAAFKRKIMTEMRVTDATQFETMFRSYRRHLEQLTTAAENRRMVHLLLLARIARGGGTAAIDARVTASPELKQELMLDELFGLLSGSIRVAGVTVPEQLIPDPRLFKGRAIVGHAQLAVTIGQAFEVTWSSRDSALADGLRFLATTEPAGSLPGLRESLTLELVDAQARVAAAPGDLLTPLLSIPHEVWREECFVVAGRTFVDRGLEKAANAWLAEQKLKPLEQVGLLYGMTLSFLDRPIPAAAASESAADPPAGR